VSDSFKYDVFLSHSSKDKPVVRELAQRLENDGLKVWLDEWEIWPGDMIGLKIEKGLEESRTLILIMSENSFASEWVTLERHTALFRDPTNAKRRFVPLRLDDTELPEILQQFSYVDWRKRSDHEYGRLLAACKVGRRSSKPKRKPSKRLLAYQSKGIEAFIAGRFEEARTAFENVCRLAEAGNHLSERIKAKTNLAGILWYFDRNPKGAKQVLESCLEELRDTDLDNERAGVLSQLGATMGMLGDFDQAESLLRQALDLERKLGRKLSEANTLVQLGWEIGHCGASQEVLELNKEAMNCFLVIYRSGDIDDRDDAIQGIAQCYFQRAKVYQREAKVEEAEANLVSCLDWQRKIEPNHELAKVLRELAGLRFHQQNWDDGKQYLTEAADIYHSLDHTLEEARCLDLIGRAYYSLGRRKEAMDCWGSAANTAAKAKDNEEAGEFCRKLGVLLLEDGHVEDAKAVLQTALDMAVREEERAVYLSSLARVAEVEHNPDERDRLLRQAIKSAKDALPGVTRPPDRALLVRDIGCYYQELEEHAEALEYFQKARQIYDSIPHVRGVAETLNVIAHLKGRLARWKEEHEDWVELRKLVDNTPHYDLIAVADINLAIFECRNGNLAEAKRLFSSAERLCRKHRLPFLSDAELNLDGVEAALAMQMPPEKRIDELIEELYGQLAMCQQNKEGYLRYWAFSRHRELVRNLRGSIGLNLWIVQDDLNEFFSLTTRFGSYVDWSFLAIPSNAADVVWDEIPFSKKMGYYPSTGFLVVRKEEPSRAVGLPPPGDNEHGPEPTVHDVADFRYSPVAQGGTKLRYVAGGLGEGSNDGPCVVGWSRVLPPQVHRLVFENDARRLKEARTFFVYHSRASTGDNLLSDLSLGKEWRVLPVYKGVLPRSKTVQLVASCEIQLPILSDVSANTPPIQACKVKQDLMQLLSCGQDAAAHPLLSQLSNDASDLAKAVEADGYLDLQVYLLKWSDGIDAGVHPAIVVND